MDLRDWVDITEIDRDTLVRYVYDVSQPVGMGFLHFTEGGLDDVSLRVITDSADQYHQGAIGMDYVHGRQCKFYVRHHEEKFYARLNWSDHGIEAMKKLLRDLKLPDVEARIAEAERGEAERQREYDEELARLRSQR